VNSQVDLLSPRYSRPSMRACRQPDFSIKHKFDIVFGNPFQCSYFRKRVGLDVCRETQLPSRSTVIIFLAFDFHCYDRSCRARIEFHIMAEEVGMYMTHFIVECSLFAVLIVLGLPCGGTRAFTTCILPNARKDGNIPTVGVCRTLNTT
jgi:hypothetical protein